jgi:hypothetical protein
MDQVKSVSHSFLTVTSIICLFTFGWLYRYVDVWVALTFCLFLALPLLIRAILFLKSLGGKNQTKTIDKVKNFIWSFQGVALGCWSFDMGTTFFSVNVRGDVELNPLGWPLGIIGAAVYYIPALIGVYFVLYKTESKSSFYAALVLTALTLFMGYMNLNAGMTNFAHLRLFNSLEPHPELITVWLATGTILSALNIAAIIKTGVDARAQKQKLQAS